MKIETLAVHAGHTIDPTTGAVTPPIHLSTTFERDPDGSYPHGHMYARNGNPNRDALERASRSGRRRGGRGFRQGSAATAAIFPIARARRSRDRPDRCVLRNNELLRELFLRWGLEATFVDMADLDAVKKRCGRKQNWSGWKRRPIRF